jgi:hypothetical protein
LSAACAVSVPVVSGLRRFGFLLSAAQLFALIESHQN